MTAYGSVGPARLLRLTGLPQSSDSDDRAYGDL
jgi:hypothetical protein